MSLSATPMLLSIPTSIAASGASPEWWLGEWQSPVVQGEVQSCMGQSIFILTPKGSSNALSTGLRWSTISTLEQGSNSWCVSTIGFPGLFFGMCTLQFHSCCVQCVFSPYFVHEIINAASSVASKPPFLLLLSLLV